MTKVLVFDASKNGFGTLLQFFWIGLIVFYSVFGLLHYINVMISIEVSRSSQCPQQHPTLPPLLSPFFPIPLPCPPKILNFDSLSKFTYKVARPHLRPHPCSNCPLTQNSKILSRNSKNFLETSNSLHKTRKYLLETQKFLP